MDRFSKKIDVGGHMQLFEFSRIKNTNGVKYFVTSKDIEGKPFSFSLTEKESRTWKLQPGATRWLYDIESELSEAIETTTE
ncbi:MAG: hypothetical protein ACJ75F_11255 [Flavisolibacter sp.]|jgi:hypothetical protein